MHEIEAKYRLPNPAVLQETLRANGFRRVDRVIELNQLYDGADGSLRQQGRALRIRTTRAIDEDGVPLADSTKAKVTYKGPVEAGPLKIREEHETSVASAEAMAAIVGALEFDVRMSFEKRRETWRGNACEVVIDELPQLGWFVEVEGPSVEAVQAVIGMLALPDADLEKKSYAQMIGEHLDERDGSQELMLRFEDE